jgi:hypothetical protein
MANDVVYGKARRATLEFSPIQLLMAADMEKNPQTRYDTPGSRLEAYRFKAWDEARALDRAIDGYERFIFSTKPSYLGTLMRSEKWAWLEVERILDERFKRADECKAKFAAWAQAYVWYRECAGYYTVSLAHEGYYYNYAARYDDNDKQWTLGIVDDGILWVGDTLRECKAFAYAHVNGRLGEFYQLAGV